VSKAEQGAAQVREYSDLAQDVAGLYAPFVTDMEPMLNDDDAHQLAASLENNSSAGLLLFEKQRTLNQSVRRDPERRA
jgi:hypothetical protein